MSDEKDKPEDEVPGVKPALRTGKIIRPPSFEPPQKITAVNPFPSPTAPTDQKQASETNTLNIPHVVSTESPVQAKEASVDTAIGLGGTNNSGAGSVSTATSKGSLIEDREPTDPVIRQPSRDLKYSKARNKSNQSLAAKQSSKKKLKEPPQALPEAARKRITIDPRLLWLLVGSVAFCLALYASGGLENAAQISDSVKKQFASQEELWKAGDYKAVLLSAIKDDNEAAQLTVIKASHGELDMPKGFRSDILSFGLEGAWLQELTSEDKRALFGYASSSLLSTDMPPLPAPSALHPGVLLAVIGNLGLKAQLGRIADLPLEKFGDLPSPYGVIFKKLRALSIDSVAAPEARALARIMVGHDDPETIAFLIASAENDEESINLVRLAAPFAEKSENLAPLTLQTLATRPGTVGDRVRWFGEPSGVAWNQVSPLAKLFIVCSVLLEEVSSDDALVDLVLYPDTQVREQSLKRLSAKSKIKEIFKILQAASLDQIKMTRPQLVGLNSLLHVPEQGRDAFVSQWFQSKPEPSIILFLLLEQSASSPNDIFNLSSAEYLAAHDKDWNASFESLKRLSEHPEPLARTLAFGRLNPEDKEQRAILESWLAREQSPAIKEQLTERLKNIPKP